MKSAMKIVVAWAFAMVAMAAQAQAVGPDFSGLTNAITFGTVITAILAVGVLIVGLRLAVKGSKILLAFIKGA